MFDRETLKNLGDSQVTTTSIFDLQCEPITNETKTCGTVKIMIKHFYYPQGHLYVAFEV